MFKNQKILQPNLSKKYKNKNYLKIILKNVDHIFLLKMFWQEVDQD